MGGDVVVAVGAAVLGVASPVAAHVTHTPPVHLCCRLDLSGARWPPPQPPAGDSYLWVHASDYFVCGNAHFPGSLPSDVAALGGQTMDHVVWRFSTLFAAPTALRLAVAPLLRELRLLFHRHGVGDVDGGATAAVAATASSSSSSSFADRQPEVGAVVGARTTPPPRPPQRRRVASGRRGKVKWTPRTALAVGRPRARARPH